LTVLYLALTVLYLALTVLYMAQRDGPARVGPMETMAIGFNLQARARIWP